MRKHLSISIYGHVQDVSFRWYARRTARELGVLGYVENAVDGSVHIEAEGESVVLDQFIAWCRKGPDRAQVDQVEVQEGSIKQYETFEIYL